MTAVVHEWGVRPIVTLESTYWEYETQWHNDNAQTFKSGIHNILKLQVEFKYKKPYGGSARYRVEIDRLVGSNWYNVITDEVGFYPDPTDTSWHTEYKEYELSIPAWIWHRIDRVVHFRITTQIEGPGHLPTGGEGSLGFWSDPESREFTATLEAPTLEIVGSYVMTMEEFLRETMDYYRTRFPHPPGPP